MTSGRRVGPEISATFSLQTPSAGKLWRGRLWTSSVLQARVATDLAGQGDDLARVASLQPRSPRVVLGYGNPILSDH